MAGEWTAMRLGDVCPKIGSGATPRGGSGVYLDSGEVALIRSQNVYNDGFRHDGLAFITPHHAKELENVELMCGDVLLNITGDSVARSCQVDDSVLPARVNQHVAIIRPDPERLDPRYLRYFLVSPNVQARMLSWAGSGGTRDALTKGMIESFEILAPVDVGEQRAIAHVLGTPDDKIELNRRINETLEAIAQALFKSWFVHFDPVRAKMAGRQPFGMDAATAALFPDSFEDSPLGKIPKGWRVCTIGDVIELAYGRALKDTARRPGPYPVYGSNGCVGWHDEYLVRGPGIVVGRKGNPGTVTWVPTDFFPIDTTFYVVPKQSADGMHYLFHSLRQQDLASLGADSAVPGLNRNMAYMSDFLLPPEPVIAAFEGYGCALSARVHANDVESQKLAELRDTLLPKLLSGQVHVKDAERFIAEVMP